MSKTYELNDMEMPLFKDFIEEEFASLELAIEPANIVLVTDPVAGAIVSTALPKNTAYIVSELVIAEDKVSVVLDTV